MGASIAIAPLQAVIQASTRAQEPAACYIFETPSTMAFSLTLALPALPDQGSHPLGTKMCELQWCAAALLPGQMLEAALLQTCMTAASQCFCAPA